MNAVLAAIVWVGMVTIVVLAPGAATNSQRVQLPEIAYEQGEGGVRVALIDTGRLVEWCRSVGLPDPPALSRAEPGVAGALVEALKQAAKQHTADAFGLVGQICESLGHYESALAFFAVARDKAPADFRWGTFRKDIISWPQPHVGFTSSATAKRTVKAIRNCC